METREEIIAESWGDTVYPKGFIKITSTIDDEMLQTIRKQFDELSKKSTLMFQTPIFRQKLEEYVQDDNFKIDNVSVDDNIMTIDATIKFPSTPLDFIITDISLGVEPVWNSHYIKKMPNRESQFTGSWPCPHAEVETKALFTSTYKICKHCKQEV